MEATNTMTPRTNLALVAASAREFLSRDQPVVSSSDYPSRFGGLFRNILTVPIAAETCPMEAAVPELARGSQIQ